MSNTNHIRRKLFVATFGLFAVVGQLGQNVILPLWIDSVRSKNASNSSAASDLHNDDAAKRNNYFIISFSSLAFTTLYGCLLLVSKACKPSSVSSIEYRFPQRQLATVGVLYAFNGFLVVFSASGTRTAPYLQSILGNFMVPMTVVFRLIVLRQKPSCLKGVCALLIFTSIVVCVMPELIPSLGASIGGGAPGYEGIIWAAVFMLGFVPLALMYVMQEKWLNTRLQVTSYPAISDERPINIFYYWFLASFYQTLTAFCFFWADVVPWFGNSITLDETFRTWRADFLCHFGGESCGYAPGLTGSLFLFFAILTNVSGTLVIRSSEGATLLAVLLALVTPCGVLFWTLFKEVPFQYAPAANNRTWFAIGSLVLMIPCIIVYNVPRDLFVRRNQPDEEYRYLFSDSDGVDRCRM